MNVCVCLCAYVLKWNVIAIHLAICVHSFCQEEELTNKKKKTDDVYVDGASVFRASPHCTAVAELIFSGEPVRAYVAVRVVVSTLNALNAAISFAGESGETI